MDYLLSHCSSLIGSAGGLWTSVLLAGLVGSLSHCSLMCSPMLAAQLLDGGRRDDMLSYHLGRATTYALLGLTAYSASRLLFGASGNAAHQLLLLAAGATFMISAALPRKTHATCHQPPTSWERAIQALSSVHAKRFLRGMFMGLMPCGMLLSVLLMVATAPHPAMAGALMLLFAVATAPVLQLAGFAVSKSCGNNPARRTQLARAAMGLNGIYICYLGLHAAASS